MIQVQVGITVDEETGNIAIPVNILAREDATEHERTIALAVEQAVLALNRAVAAQVGEDVQYTEQLIGPQHETARPLTFGCRVRVGSTYKRRQRHTTDRGWVWLKWWEAQKLEQPREGLYIGYRTLADGKSEYIGSEEGTAFTADRHFRAALVVFGERNSPVLVPLEAIEAI